MVLNLGYTFSTTGIRGKTNVELTPIYCMKVGYAIANWFKQSKNHPRILMGQDNRISSPMIFHAISSALISSGVNIEFMDDAVPTPLIVHVVSEDRYDGGIMITGSHLPPSDNGIILFAADGSYFKGVLNDPEDPYEPWNHLGKLTINIGGNERYLVHLKATMKYFNLPKMFNRLLIDTVHGPMGSYLLPLLISVAREIEPFNVEKDPYISGRPSEPKPDTLKKTVKHLLYTKCDFGITTDFDGDRVVFISKKGNVVTGDYAGALLAIQAWKEHPEAPIVIPINTSAIINEIAQQYNGKFEYVNVGAPSIIDGMKHHKAYFGFEETGKFFFYPDSMYPDAAFTSLKILKLMNDTGKTMDEFLDELPKYYAVKIKIPSERKTWSGDRDIILDNAIDKLVENIGYSVESKYTFDGIRINFSNNSWVLIRQSGTEDYLRVFTESKDPKISEQLSTQTKEFLATLFAANS